MGQFERIRYPDGQIGAKINEVPNDVDAFLIKERINSYEDLFYIRSIADVINSKAMNGSHTTSSYRLFIPCLFGQRSDRRFSSDQSFDLKVITDVINSCEFQKVTIFDPHSDVSLALINNSEKQSSFEFVKRVIDDLVSYPDTGQILFVSPDAGAYKKVYEYGERLGYPVMGAMKYRDKAGKVTLKFTEDVTGFDCLIVDDLCDGGYTFNVLAKALREKGARKVYLYVSHGLFSKGFVELFQNIDHIYCSNSIKDLNSDDQFIFRFKDGAKAALLLGDFITQYKII